MTKRPFPAYRGSEPFVFASYAHSEAPTVYALLTGLRNRGTNIWYDEGIQPGSDWRDELAAAIDGCESLVFFVSKASISSRNCLKEVNFALSRNKRVVLVFLEPVALPAGLEMSLGDEQGVEVQHHEPTVVLDKLVQAIAGQGAARAAAARPAPALGSARQPGARRWPFVAGFALALAILLLYLQRPGTEQNEASAERPQGPPVIAIAPFRNLTGDRELEWFGGGVATLVADQLATSKHLVMVSSAAWDNISSSASEPEPLRAQARKAGIDYLVSGELVPSPDGLLLSLRTTDLRNGVNIGAQSLDALSRNSLVSASRQISRNLMQTLNLPREALLETLSADFVSSDFAAYEAYLSSLRFYNRFEYDQAITALTAALAITPDFHMARFRLANIQMSQSHWRQAQETLAAIPNDAPLPDRERAYVTGLGQMLDGLYPAAIETFEALLERSPYDVEAQQFLAECYYRDFQAEKALEVLDRLAVQEPENHHVWAAMGYMALSLGDVDRSAQALRRYAEIAPDLPHPWQLLGNLAMHEQQPEVALGHFRKALALEQDFTPAQLGEARAQAYLGDYSGAKAVLQTLAEASDARVFDRISAAINLASLLQAEHRFDAVDRVFEPIQDLLHAEQGRVALVLTERAYAAMASGRLDDADALVREAIAAAPAEGVPTRYLFARGMLELRRGEYESIPVTAAAIRRHALPAEDPDQTEEQAALLLEGLALAQRQQFPQSVKLLNRAAATQGYAYRSTTLALAKAQAGAGDLEAALASSLKAIAERPQYQAAEPRLDLEAERREALELATGLACALRDEAAQAQLRKLAVPAWQATLNCDELKR